MDPVIQNCFLNKFFSSFTAVVLGFLGYKFLNLITKAIHSLIQTSFYLKLISGFNDVQFLAANMDHY